jgi:penicillin-binding protein 1A
MFLTSEKTWKRKLKEALLAVKLEMIYSKDEILEAYLNEIYFGTGVYGVQEASLKYFGRNVWDLDISQAAILAAIPKSPSYYNPYTNAKACLERRNLVLQRMFDLDFISAQQYEDARKSPLSIVVNESNESYSFGLYFVEYIRILLASIYGEKIYRSGFSVYTTLDIKAQKAAEQALERHLASFDKSKNNNQRVQGALLAVVPQTGEIRAMVGGRDFNESKFNRAVQAQRQPGSSFKPFVYLAAINKGFTAATLLSDRPMTFRFDTRLKRWLLYSRTQDEGGKIGNTWTPKNYSGRYKGDVILADAIAQSINMAAIETLTAVGNRAVIDTAKKLGIASPLIDAPSLALGSSEVNLMEMVSAYSVFAAKGVKSEPFVIEKIDDRSGNTIFKNEVIQERVISERESFVMTSLLGNVISRGSGVSARGLGRPAAGKTGTTNDSSDAWFVAFTPELSAGVWVGYDDRNIKLGKNITGGAIAVPIWTDFMRTALKGKPIKRFEQPKGIEWAYIDANTGLLASNASGIARYEAFVKGTAPANYRIGIRLNVYNSVPPESEIDIETETEAADEANISERAAAAESGVLAISLRARQLGDINAVMPSNARSLNLYISKSNPYYLGEKNRDALDRWILQLSRYRNAEIVINWDLSDKNLERLDYRRFASLIRDIVSEEQKSIQRIRFK